MSMRFSWSSAATRRSVIFRDLALDLAQLLHRLGAHLLVDLDDLELGLGDAALSAWATDA